MSPTLDRPFGRRLLVTLTVLGLFVLADLALFGWLLFRSLSQREIEQALLSTRREAEELAQQLEESIAEADDDLYTVVAREVEARTYIDSILRQRDIVRTVEINDKDGVLVFRQRSEDTIPIVDDGSASVEAPPPVEVGPGIQVTTEGSEHTFETYDLTLPIGELGSLHVGISGPELDRRVVELRRDLVRQTGSIGALTLVVLALAYATIWWLWRRGRRLEREAADRKRMAYLGTLASGLAHEIRNPLNSLNLNIQMLEEEIDGGGDTSRQRLLQLTRSELGRLERLVTDFLSYAKPRPLELQPTRAVALLERCREILLPQARSQSAELVVEDLSAGREVEVDPEQLLQLLLNLAHNALSSTEGIERPARVWLRAVEDRDQVRFEVQDNGIGLVPEVRQKMFDLFYSTRKGGTGLGLSIVQRIARAHDADLEVASVPGEGTSVRVTLAAVARHEPADAPVQGSESTSSVAVAR